MPRPTHLPETTMNTIKKLFQKPSARVLAQQELEEAKRQLLRSYAAAEYHQKMSAYYDQAVRRLTTYLKAEEA